MAAGFGAGLLAALLMLSAIEVTDTVIVDLRHVAISIAAIYAGPAAAVTAGLIAGAVRIVFFGVNDASLTASIVAAATGPAFAFLAGLKLARGVRYTMMNVLYVSVSSYCIHVLVDDPAVTQRVLLNYWLVGVIGVIFIYYVAEYIRKSGEDHRSILYYKLMADNSTDLISTHRLDGTFQYLSPSSVRILGYRPDELVGQTPYGYYHPDDLKEIGASHATVRETDREGVARYRFRRKDGQYVWLETTSRKMTDVHCEVPEMVCVTRDVTERKRMEEALVHANHTLQRLSTLDGLTDIPNRRAFDRRYDEEWRRAVRHSSPLSLIVFDVDLFKSYNDTYGHQQGDECLKKVAKAAQSVLNRPSDYIARYGGEEFAVILPDTGPEGARLIAERICRAVAELEIPHRGSHVRPSVTVSVGVASTMPTVDSSELRLIAGADEAMYRAKRSGRNRVGA